MGLGLVKELGMGFGFVEGLGFGLWVSNMDRESEKGLGVNERLVEGESLYGFKSWVMLISKSALIYIQAWIQPSQLHILYVFKLAIN